MIIEYESNIINSLRNRPAISKNLIERAIDAFIFFGDCLPNDVCDRMEKRLESLSHQIIREENAEVFQTGMVGKLKKKVDEVIADFEKSCYLKLRIEFKWILHLFANQKFCASMEKYQKKWDEEHNPLTILTRNKAQYLYVIHERLEKGVNFGSDGIIAGSCLVNAVRQIAVRSANRQRIQEILDTTWLINTENVRLKYFSELVEQIRNKIYSQALNHFNDPKCQIEIWFINKINSFSSGKAYKQYNKVMVSELHKILQDIKLHSSIAETRVYIEEYISTCDGINFPESSDPDIENRANFGLFSEKLIEILDYNLKHLPKFSNSDLIRPSDETQVMDRMGCTYACPVCSALCWGQNGHDDDVGDTKKHHTCHQPMGLSGTFFINSSMIATEMCHEQRLNTIWYVGNQKLPWEDVMKLSRYKNWNFGRHVNKKFDDMMKWFFLKLNKKIALRYGKKPARKEDINSLNIQSLDIGQIIAEINQKIRN